MLVSSSNLDMVAGSWNCGCFWIHDYLPRYMNCAWSSAKDVGDVCTAT